MTYFTRAMIFLLNFELWHANYRLRRVSDEFFYGDVSDLMNITVRRRRIQAEVMQIQADLSAWSLELLNT